jgi:hypothetical protein
LSYRGWSKRVVDDLEPVISCLIVGIEAQCLAKEDGGGIILVTSCGELAEQAICGPAGRIESDDVAKVGLSFELSAKRDMRACTHQQERHTLRFVFEGVLT